MLRSALLVNLSCSVIALILIFYTLFIIQVFDNNTNINNNYGNATNDDDEFDDDDDNPYEDPYDTVRESTSSDDVKTNDVKESKVTGIKNLEQEPIYSNLNQTVTTTNPTTYDVGFVDGNEEESIYEPITPTKTTTTEKKDQNKRKDGFPNRPPPPPPASPRPFIKKQEDQLLKATKERSSSAVAVEPNNNNSNNNYSPTFIPVIVKSSETEDEVNYSPHSFVGGMDSIDGNPAQPKGSTTPKSKDKTTKSKGNKKHMFVYPSKPEDHEVEDTRTIRSVSPYKERSSGFDESILSTLTQKPIPEDITIPATIEKSFPSNGDVEATIVKIEKISPGDSEYNTTPPASRQLDDDQKLKNLLGFRDSPSPDSKRPMTERRSNANDDVLFSKHHYRSQRGMKAQSEIFTNLDNYQPRVTAGYARNWFSKVSSHQPATSQQREPSISKDKEGSSMRTSPRNFDHHQYHRHSQYSPRDFDHPHHHRYSQYNPMSSYELKASRRDNYNSPRNGRGPSDSSSWRNGESSNYGDPGRNGEPSRLSSYENYLSPHGFDARFDHSDHREDPRKRNGDKKKGLRRINSHQPTTESNDKENSSSTSASSKVRGFFRAAKRTLRKHKSVNSNQHYSTKRQDYFEKNIGDV